MPVLSHLFRYCFLFLFLVLELPVVYAQNPDLRNKIKPGTTWFCVNKVCVSSGSEFAFSPNSSKPFLFSLSFTSGYYYNLNGMTQLGENGSWKIKENTLELHSPGQFKVYTSVPVNNSAFLILTSPDKLDSHNVCTYYFVRNMNGSVIKY
jgi:hypothetical protein